ncbi:uncharacterized protein LOC113324898 [Papaver somniferum]|uniref:uncharacterized protein LOC113324898 n=1 Tax=Papaver somniferum TaxID=3469 RepID=UPI000E703F74|nr:uncharacterized protein LOC113324898 [Papaver somniferum]
MSHFQALYGYVPPHMAFPTSSTTSIAVVETYLKEGAQKKDLLKESLHGAQKMMKLHADTTRVERSFNAGDLVYLKLQPYRQASVTVRRNFKLYAKYYGPFPILQKIGPVAYKIELPSHSRIHPVLYVSQLKKHIGTQLIPSLTMPVVGLHGDIIMVPERVLQQRTVLIGSKLIRQVLIQWTNSSPENATWEAITNIRTHYPRFILEDKDPAQGEAMLYT